MTAIRSTSAAISAASVRPVLAGLLLGVLTLLFGFFMGGVFGLNEDAIKGRLSASATAVQGTVYGQDATAAKPVLEKSWSTGLAKESLAWLAIPSSGAVIAATCAVGVLLALAIVRPAPGVTAR
jgi:20S proteasome alpha/beta subunit